VSHALDDGLVNHTKKIKLLLSVVTKQQNFFSTPLWTVLSVPWPAGYMLTACLSCTVCYGPLHLLLSLVLLFRWRWYKPIFYRLNDSFANGSVKVLDYFIVVAPMLGTTWCSRYSLVIPIGLYRVLLFFKKCWWSCDLASRTPRHSMIPWFGKFDFKPKISGPISFHLGCDFKQEEDDTLRMAPQKIFTQRGHMN